MLMNTMKLNKGDKIQIVNDSILKAMGIERATGTVFTLNDHGDCIGFQCDQTGKIECFDDGDVTLLESIKPPSVETAEESVVVTPNEYRQQTMESVLGFKDSEKLDSDFISRLTKHWNHADRNQFWQDEYKNDDPTYMNNCELERISNRLIEQFDDCETIGDFKKTATMAYFVDGPSATAKAKAGKENPDLLEFEGVSLNQETNMVTLSVNDLEKLQTDGLWSVIYHVFMLKLTEFLKPFPFIVYETNNNDNYPNFWIDLTKAFGLAEKYAHMGDLNSHIANVIEGLTFKNLKFEHSISMEHFVDTITPSFDMKNWQGSIYDIKSDLQMIADAIQKLEIQPFGIKGMSDSTKEYDHTDTCQAMAASLKILCDQINSIDGCEESALSETGTTLIDLDKNKTDIDWLTDRLTQATLDLKDNSEGGMSR